MKFKSEEILALGLTGEGASRKRTIFLLIQNLWWNNSYYMIHEWYEVISLILNESSLVYTLLNHIDSACLQKVSSIFKTGSTLKCRNALGFDFTQGAGIVN